MAVKRKGFDTIKTFGAGKKQRRNLRLWLWDSSRQQQLKRGYSMGRGWNPRSTGGTYIVDGGDIGDLWLKQG